VEFKKIKRESVLYPTVGVAEVQRTAAVNSGLSGVPAPRRPKVEEPGREGAANRHPSANSERGGGTPTVSTKK
jgi:hypothetical protein